MILAPEEQNQLKKIIKLASSYFQKFIHPMLKKENQMLKEKIIENLINEITKNRPKRN